MIETGNSVQATMDQLGIVQVDANALDELCREILDQNEAVVQQIRDGNEKAVGALIGKARKLNPNANPGQVRSRLLEMIRQG